jgi:hypothetical protein
VVQWYSIHYNTAEPIGQNASLASSNQPAWGEEGLHDLLSQNALARHRRLTHYLLACWRLLWSWTIFLAVLMAWTSLYACAVLWLVNVNHRSMIYIHIHTHTHTYICTRLPKCSQSTTPCLPRDLANIFEKATVHHCSVYNNFAPLLNNFQYWDKYDCLSTVKINWQLSARSNLFFFTYCILKGIFLCSTVENPHIYLTDGAQQKVITLHPLEPTLQGYTDTSSPLTGVKISQNRAVIRTIITRESTTVSVQAGLCLTHGKL